MKNGIALLIFSLLHMSCRSYFVRTDYVPDPVSVSCAVSLLRLSDSLILGNFRESAMTRKYRRPRIRMTADSAFVESCSMRFLVVPDDTLQRILGTAENRDTIMTRLAKRNIPILMVPSIVKGGHMVTDIYRSESDSITFVRYVNEGVLHKCQPMSPSDQPAFHRCVSEQVKLATIEMIDSLFPSSE